MKGGLLKRVTSKGSKNKSKSNSFHESGDQSSPDNNNEQLLQMLNERIQLSDDEASASSSGRGGSGSGFSSASSDEETHKRSSESLASSSGRSSANQQQADEMRELATSNLGNRLPERPEVVELIERVRVRFLDSLGDQVDENNNKFDPIDLEEMRRPLASLTTGQLHQYRAARLISRFLDFNDLLMDNQSPDAATVDKALAEAADKLRDLLHFRQHQQLEHVLADDFCKEIYQLHGIFQFGRDKDGLPVLYLRARVHRRWSAKMAQMFERYVAWQIDQITKSNHSSQAGPCIPNNPDMKDGSFGICFDTLNVSYSCVDMDFLSYLVKILVNYYPSYCRYAVCVDLPWLFRSVWRLVRSWLPEEAQKTVHLITSKQLTEFIDEDQIPNSMKINDLAGSKKSPRGKHKMPADFDTLRNFEQWAQELNLTSSEIKQFKSHVEKVIKEYEQMGAM